MLGQSFQIRRIFLTIDWQQMSTILYPAIVLSLSHIIRSPTQLLCLPLTNMLANHVLVFHWACGLTFKHCWHMCHAFLRVDTRFRRSVQTTSCLHHLWPTSIRPTFVSLICKGLDMAPEATSGSMDRWELYSSCRAMPPPRASYFIPNFSFTKHLLLV